MRKQRSFMALVFLAICTVLVLSGCSGKSTSAPPADLGPLANTLSNYDDIELPAEMKLNNKKTMSIKTDSFRGGVLHYGGKVEITSLKDFLIASMKNNQWKHVGEASYDNILLAFTKPNKTCLAIIEEGFGGSLGTTYLELYITVDVAASQRLNPFGEPVSN